MKRFGLIAAAMLVLALFIAPAAHAICTCVQVSTTSAKVLAANDQGSNGRKQLWLTNGGSSVAYCDIGNSSGATAQQGFAVFPGQVVPIPAAQQAAKTFPITPNGEVDCVVQANQAGTNASMCACDN